MAHPRQQPPAHRAVLTAIALFIAGIVLAIHPSGPAFATSGLNPYTVPLVIDTNPDPGIVETTIIADESTVAIGNGVMANALTFNGQIPGPEFRLKVGDTVIVHFENHLDHETGIHWHGIELANASDGTPLVQNQVPAGGKFLYKFQVTRPGIFWYHPHHHSSTNQVFKGLYGTIVITDPNEAALQASGALPSAADTRTLALGDITVCKAPGSNDAVTFDPTLPHVSGGALPANPGPTPVALCETAPIDEEGMPRSPFAAGDVPNIQRNSGTVGEGQTVLTNGMNVGGRAGTPAAPGALAAGAQTMDVLAGQGLRLQIGSEATTRFFRLRLTSATGTQIPLVRVGGQGGLLDNAVVEGGVVAGFNFKYDTGEVLLDPGDRVDVVAAIPAGAGVGDILTLWTEDIERTGAGFARTPTVPVAHFKVTGTAGSAYAIAAGTPLRAATGNPVETLPAATGTLLDPATFAPPKPGMSNPDIQLTNTGSMLGINEIHGEHDFPGIDYTLIDQPDSARYAKLGDVLELTVTNATGAHHPFHLHGFSIQPLSLTDTQPGANPPNPDVVPGIGPSYTFPYREFRDNIDVPAGYTLRFRVRLDDRPLMDGTTPGGGLGRWVFHCHIFFHASYGMISEFDVVSATGNEAPHVNSDAVSVAVDAGQIATMTGTYLDPDGDPVTLTASIGSVTDTGAGTWEWSYLTTGAPGEPGPVYITGTDTAGLKGQAVFTLTVNPTAKSLKQNVLAQANALLPGLPQKEANKLEAAIKKLGESLDPALWIDGNHVVDKDGQRVFDREKYAANKLEDLINDNSIPDATLEGMIDSLVVADRMLAEQALADAIAAAGDPDKIAEAQQELDKAAAELLKGHTNAAIDHFRNAWRKALQAV